MFYSKWTSEKDLKKYLTEVEIGSEMQKSGIQMLSEENKIYIKDDESHSLVIGSAGSGKTQAVVLPLVRTIIKSNESFLINDVKGEIMNKVGGELKKRGYNIIVLDYANLKIGNHYNVLDFPYYLYNNDEKDKAIEILENIAYYIMHDIDSTSDPFWEKTAGDYFVGLALYLFDNAKSEEINLNSIFNLSNDIFKDEKGYDKLIMNSLDKSSSTYQFLSGTLFSPKETSGGIIATFSQKIKGFVTREKLSSMMATSDFDFKNIGNEKTAIFVITGTANYANDLVSILVDELFYSLDLFKNKNNRFFLMSAEEIEFCDKYDIVTSIMVNHYFNKTVRERVILNCYKALKKGGVLFSFENFAPNTGFGKSMQLKRWKKYQINNGKSENEAESHINRYGVNYYPITISSQLDILKKCGFNKYETIWISGMQAGFMGIK